MNRSIRKRHRVIWLILAILLPMILIISIARRHARPVNDLIPKVERMK